MLSLVDILALGKDFLHSRLVVDMPGEAGTSVLVQQCSWAAAVVQCHQYWFVDLMAVGLMAVGLMAVDLMAVCLMAVGQHSVVAVHPDLPQSDIPEGLHVDQNYEDYVITRSKGVLYA